MSLPPEPGSRGGRLALAAAWLLVIGVIAAAVGFVVMERQKPRQAPVAKLVLSLPPEIEEAAEADPDRPPDPVTLPLPEQQDPPETQRAQLAEVPSVPEEAVTPAVTPATLAPSEPEAPQGKPAEPESVSAVAEPAGPETAPAEAAAETAETQTGETAMPAPARLRTPETPPATAPEEQAAEEPVPRVEAPEEKAEVTLEEAEPFPREALSDTSPVATPPLGGEPLARLQLPPWRRYGSATQADGERPRIAVVVVGLGQSAAATEAAIKNLPAAITLSFSPYARRLNQMIALARVNDHEVMLDLPMEPTTFPEDDPGPYALLTVLDAEENRRRLDWVLQRGNSYVGVVAIMGSRFAASANHLRPVLAELKARGLLYLDNAAGGKGLAEELAAQLELPFVKNDRMLDAAQASRVAINARLTQLERLALEHGFSVAIGQPYPVTIERLAQWSTAVRGRGFDLVPITALIGQKRRVPALVEQQSEEPEIGGQGEEGNAD